MHKFVSTTIGVALLATFAGAQELVLPTGTAWGAPTYTVTGTSPWGSSTAIWSSGLFHRQYLYEASHFTNNGVAGPVLINRLRFRCEDGARYIGGHTWSNVTVTLGSAPGGMTSATMSTTFATNLAVAGTPELFPAVVDGNAAGSVPNTAIIDINLTTGAFMYDPTLGNALVIDVNSPAPPVPTTNIPGMAISNSQTVYLCRQLTTTTAAALTGTLSATVPSILIDFVGNGGKVGVVPARNASLGSGCGGNARSFYQYFDGGEVFDLANTSLLLTPDNTVTPNNYTVTAGVTPVDLTKATGAVSTGDDSVVSHTMGWTFNYPGGTTPNVRGCTNGYAWVGGTTTTGDFSVTVNEFLGVGGSATLNTARFAPMWHDFHAGNNIAFNPLSGMYHSTDTSGGPGNFVTYITWVDISEFNVAILGQSGASVNSFQMVLSEATMTVEFRYGNIQSQAGIAVTGFSPGWNTVASVDSGSRDLSGEVPFTTNGPDGLPNMKLVQNGTVGPVNPGRAHLGNTISCSASNIPATHVIGSFFTDFAVVAPGVNVPPFLAPGCNYNLTGTSSLYALAFGAPIGNPLSNPTVSSPLFIPVVPAFCGAVLYTQFVSWDANFPFGGSVSNVVAATIGSN